MMIHSIVTATLLSKYIENKNNHIQITFYSGNYWFNCLYSEKRFIHVIGGSVTTCTAGPSKISLKEAFDNNHWINKSVIMA